MPQHTVAVGDLVILDPQWVQPRHPQLVYRVTKLAPVNATATPVGTAGRPVKADKSMFLPAPPGLAAAALAAEATAPAPFWPGTVVTVSGPGWREPAGRLYVVPQLKRHHRRHRPPRRRRRSPLAPHAADRAHGRRRAAGAHRRLIVANPTTPPTEQATDPAGGTDPAVHTYHEMKESNPMPTSTNTNDTPPR